MYGQYRSHEPLSGPQTCGNEPLPTVTLNENEDLDSISHFQSEDLIVSPPTNRNNELPLVSSKVIENFEFLTNENMDILNIIPVETPNIDISEYLPSVKLDENEVPTSNQNVHKDTTECENLHNKSYKPDKYKEVILINESLETMGPLNQSENELLVGDPPTLDSSQNKELHIISNQSQEMLFLNTNNTKTKSLVQSLNKSLTTTQTQDSSENKDLHSSINKTEEDSLLDIAPGTTSMEPSLTFIVEKRMHPSLKSVHDVYPQKKKSKILLKLESFDSLHKTVICNECDQEKSSVKDIKHHMQTEHSPKIDLKYKIAYKVIYILTTIILKSSVLDPDPLGSVSFRWIRILIIKRTRIRVARNRGKFTEQSTKINKKPIF